MKYCPNCGQKLNEEGICPNCGTKNNINENEISSKTGIEIIFTIVFIFPAYFFFRSCIGMHL